MAANERRERPFPRLLPALVLVAALAACAGRATGVTVRRGLEYARPGGTPLRLDAFVPAGRGPHPAVLLVHGGGWTRGSRADLTRDGLWLAERGFAAFAADYRLAPRHRFPAALDDLRGAVRWIRSNAARFRLDPSKVAAFGASAGGHLAAMLAVGKGDAHVRAAVSWSGAMDLGQVVADAPADVRADVRRLVARFLGCDPTECRARARRASPIHHVGRGDAPVLIANSRDEVPSFGQAAAMARALHASGVPHRLVEIPGRLHAGEYSVEEVPAGASGVGSSLPQTVLGASLDFLRKYVPPVQPAGSGPSLGALLGILAVLGWGGLRLALWIVARGAPAPALPPGLDPRLLEFQKYDIGTPREFAEAGADHVMAREDDDAGQRQPA